MPPVKRSRDRGPKNRRLWLSEINGKIGEQLFLAWARKTRPVDGKILPRAFAAEGRGAALTPMEAVAKLCFSASSA